MTESSGRNHGCDILFVVNEFPPGPGGIGTHAYEIVKGLHALGLKVIVLCNQDYAAPESIREFNSRQPFTIRTNIRGRKWYVLRRIIFLLKMGFRHKPRIMITSGSNASLYAMFPEYILGIPKVTFIHGPEYSMNFPHVLTRFVLRRAKLAAVSNYSKKFFLKCGLKRPIEIINNGASSGKYLGSHPSPELRKKWKLDGRKIILTVGRMCSRKGQDVVIRAMADVKKEVPDALYVLVGHEEQRESLSALTGELGLEDNVLFVGQVHESELPSFYSMADVYVLNSRHSPDGDIEGFGISILEAAFCGVPAVGTRDCGIEDAIEHGETGLLVSMDSPGETAKALVEILKDPERRKKMGEAARNRALEHFTWERAVKQTRELIREYL